MPEPVGAGAYAVIFTSRRTTVSDGYDEIDRALFEAAQRQPGFLGYESAGSDDFGITISYWASEADIAAWKADADHLVAQHRGRAEWYEHYDVRVCRVERAYDFTAPDDR